MTGKYVSNVILINKINSNFWVSLVILIPAFILKTGNKLSFLKLQTLWEHKFWHSTSRIQSSENAVHPNANDIVYWPVLLISRPEFHLNPFSALHLRGPLSRLCVSCFCCGRCHIPSESSHCGPVLSQHNVFRCLLLNPFETLHWSRDEKLKILTLAPSWPPTSCCITWAPWARGSEWDPTLACSHFLKLTFWHPPLAFVHALSSVRKVLHPYFSGWLLLGPGKS